MSQQQPHNSLSPSPAPTWQQPEASHLPRSADVSPVVGAVALVPYRSGAAANLGGDGRTIEQQSAQRAEQDVQSELEITKRIVEIAAKLNQDPTWHDPELQKLDSFSKLPLAMYCVAEDVLVKRYATEWQTDDGATATLKRNMFMLDARRPRGLLNTIVIAFPEPAYEAEASKKGSSTSELIDYAKETLGIDLLGHPNEAITILGRLMRVGATIPYVHREATESDEAYRERRMKAFRQGVYEHWQDHQYKMICGIYGQPYKKKMARQLFDEVFSTMTQPKELTT